MARERKQDPRARLRAPVGARPRGTPTLSRPPRSLRLAQLARWPRPVGLLLVALVAVPVATIWRPALYVAAGAWALVALVAVLDARLRGRTGAVAAIVGAVGGPLPASVMSLFVRRQVRKVTPAYRVALPFGLLAAVVGGALALTLGRWATDEAATTLATPSASMAEKIRKGDRLLVAPLLLGEPGRGDIVAVRMSRTARVALDRRGPVAGVYRVIGLPGDYVVALEDQLYICTRAPDILDGITDEDGCEPRDELAYVSSPMEDFGPIAVRQGQYLVLGDNRELIDDSRAFGTVPTSAMIGRVVATVWPLSRLGVR